MNDVVLLVERNRRNNLTANFSGDQRSAQGSVLRFAVGSYIQLKIPFFVEVRGLKKLQVDQDWDWAKTAVKNTGLRENFVRDGGIEEPYWGPSQPAQALYVNLFYNVNY